MYMYNVLLLHLYFVLLHDQGIPQQPSTGQIAILISPPHPRVECPDDVRKNVKFD